VIALQLHLLDLTDHYSSFPNATYPAKDVALMNNLTMAPGFFGVIEPADYDLSNLGAYLDNLMTYELLV